MLVERAGEVVTKEDLLQAVWPDSFVEDTGLTRNISLLRQALGDDGQRFIVTAPDRIPVCGASSNASRHRRPRLAPTACCQCTQAGG